jgi:glycosyltransferase involved in cell wall biosynthesis
MRIRLPDGAFAEYPPADLSNRLSDPWPDPISGLVSIVILSYNNWPDLELTIQSALHQSYQPVEVIVVDNSSPDGTAEHVARRFGTKVQLVQHPNLWAAGRTTGMRLAHGEFVQFLDGDDFIAPDKIESQVEAFNSEPEIDINYGDWRWFQLRPGTVDRWEDADQQDYPDMLAALTTEDGCKLAHGCFLYRRRALDRVGDWDAALYVADRDYWLRAAWAGCQFRHVPGALFFYQWRAGQMTRDQIALQRGFEAVWVKSLGYVTAEPYRGRIKSLLAGIKLQLALRPGTLHPLEAVAEIVAAHRMAPETVPWPRAVLAAALACVPGGRSLAAAPVLASFRIAIRNLIAARCGK